MPALIFIWNDAGFNDTMVPVKTDYNTSSSSDNLYSNFFTAMYFWINGIWNQRNYWDACNIINITLVSIMQNMFIAFMRYFFFKKK